MLSARRKHEVSFPPTPLAGSVTVTLADCSGIRAWASVLAFSVPDNQQGGFQAENCQHACGNAFVTIDGTRIKHFAKTFLLPSYKTIQLQAAAQTTVRKRIRCEWHCSAIIQACQYSLSLRHRQLFHSYLQLSAFTSLKIMFSGTLKQNGGGEVEERNVCEKWVTVLLNQEWSLLTWLTSEDGR